MSSQNRSGDSTRPHPAAYQPEPLSTLVVRFRGLTAIARTWPAGQARLCRRCASCSAVGDPAVGDHCLVATSRPVAEGEAWRFGLDDGGGRDGRPRLRVVG